LVVVLVYYPKQKRRKRWGGEEWGEGVRRTHGFEAKDAAAADVQRSARAPAAVATKRGRTHAPTGNHPT
jgi:hypothetical protein